MDSTFQVKVKPGRIFFTDIDRVYPMVATPRGLALIINNETFACPSFYTQRYGSAADTACLRSLFEQLGFTVTVAQNLTRNETLIKIIEFSDLLDHSEANMAIVCISSHGSDAGKIISSDCRELDLEQDILRRFNNEYCPKLKGKPKFFIIQACRGEEQDYGVHNSPHSKRTDRDEARGRTTDARMVLQRGHRPRSWAPHQPELSWEDILIAYSTLPGYVANRDCTKGTWFVQSLCKIFMEHAHNTNLRDMLDLVALDLKQNFTSETGTKQSFNYDVRHFYKKLYFNPGLQVRDRGYGHHAWDGRTERPRTRSLSSLLQRITTSPRMARKGGSKR